MWTISLDGIWQLRWSDGERGDRLKRMNEGTAALDRSWAARVPGCVHATLIEHGVIAEPNEGANVLACRWVEEMTWFYRRTFDVPELATAERGWLVFDALDLAASVYLNGAEVGRHANAFYPCRIEVTDQLRGGDNTLVVQIESGLLHAAHRSGTGYGVHPGHELTKRPWLRKTQSEHGWDWAPRMLNIGISGSVRLEIAAGTRWEGGVVLSALSDSLETGTVTGRVFVEGLEGKPLTTTLSVEVAGMRQETEVCIRPGSNRIDLTLMVPKPELWWPTGHGGQPLYEVTVELLGVGRLTRRIGFRHVRVNQATHPASGNYFIIEINHKQIFCKGGNLVPEDLIPSRVDRARYEMLVDRALESNFNLLRVWGGGLYEREEFYDLCDERGLMVWQEFVFACAKYPANDEAFLADVKREATHQIRRLAHRASLVLWCGNNEMEWGTWHWGYDSGVAHPDYALFHMALPRLLDAEDGTRYYQPSSPFSPGFADPTADDRGDQHPWSIGFHDNDFRKYREMICRFPNEGGILGPTALPTMRAALAGGLEKPGTFAWELHDNSLSYWDAAAGVASLPTYAPDRMIEQWVGRRVMELSISDYVYWAGLVQGAGLAEYVKNFRRRMFDSAAAIFWMYNDVWPCSRSWTTVDYYGRRTPAFWPVRRAMAPTTVVITREADKVRVYGVNDGEARELTLRYGLMELAGAYPLDKTCAVRLAANASTVLVEFEAEQWDRLGIDRHVAFAILGEGSGEVARDTLILPIFKYIQWPEAKVRVAWTDGKAVFTSDTFAWRVCLDLNGEKKLPDNFFDIYPEIPTVLDWPEQLGVPRVVRLGNGNP